jgi:hypothetical protein
MLEELSEGCVSARPHYNVMKKGRKKRNKIKNEKIS